MYKQATDALYLFTDCEVSYAPNACVIQDGKPVFTTVTNLLAHSTRQTTCLLEQELKLQQHALEEKLLAAQLEKIFIEKTNIQPPYMHRDVGSKPDRMPVPMAVSPTILKKSRGKEVASNIKLLESIEE